MGTLPVSPDDRDGLYHGLLWVAWAVEECSRGFTRLSTRLTTLERRLDRLDEETPAEPRPDLRPELTRLEATIGERHRETMVLIEGVEERVRQLEFLPLKVSNLQRSVDQLAAAHRKAMDDDHDRAAASRSRDRDIQELRRELAGTREALAALDPQAVSTLIEEAVLRRTERLAEDLPAAGTDVEGVYRELDAVAEFVAARAASTAESLERIGPLELAVLELRRDLGRARGDPSASHDSKETELRLQDLEWRLRTLESREERVERFFAAVAGAVGAHAGEVSASGANGSTPSGHPPVTHEEEPLS
jgi:chromosome segregation ATPase